MKKTGIIIATVVAFLVLGGMIIAWSVYQKGEVTEEEARVRDITDDNFQVEVVEASKQRPILIDFYADWCFPCKLMDPALQELARDFKGKAVIGKVNTDKNLIARRFGIQRIPAIFIIRHGEIKDVFYGVVEKERMVKALKDFGA
jgi:thioredoxin 1